jgi:hypothetical protein
VTYVGTVNFGTPVWLASTIATFQALPVWVITTSLCLMIFPVIAFKWSDAARLAAFRAQPMRTLDEIMEEIEERTEETLAEIREQYPSPFGHAAKASNAKLKRIGMI